MGGKKYSVVGIGNAIVDVFAHIDDHFLTVYNLEKGITRLIDEDEVERLHSAVRVVNQASGGSAANTIAGLASLGHSVSYIGKVKNDPFGAAFEDGLKSYGVSFDAKKVDEGLPTARCVVLITPDAERTMNTCLGIASYLGPDDVDEGVIANSDITYLEGYLWDRHVAKKAFLKAIDATHRTGGKVALSLSDPFCVNRHKAEFLDLVKNRVDILFANEEEIKSLFTANTFESAVNRCKNIDIIYAITRGEKGSVVISGDELHTIKAAPVSKVVDSTGAGDLYAAGFLNGIIQEKDLYSCGRMGGIAASEIVSHFGARPQTPLADLMKINGL